MIKYLRLTNFRRHENTELRFEEGSQVVLISGSNGVGKSTIFEALLFALYGEGRNGRANLERLVRKGGEIEGMEVELEFDLAGTTYRVRRRRDSKMTSAALYGNEEPLVEGSREVTAEVARVLAMDARGFKAATYAQQKELDGLASMRPGDRGKMLARLLRLDVLTRAKEQARSEFNDQRALAAKLPTTIDLTAVNADKATQEAAIETLEGAVNAAREALVTIDATLAATEGVEVRYTDAMRHFVAAETRLIGAHEEVARVRHELSSLHVPPAIPTSETPLDVLQMLAADVERQILKGEQAERDTHQAESLHREVARCNTEISALEAVLARETVDVATAETDLKSCNEKIAELEETLATSREAYAAAKERLARAENSLAQAEGLDAECDTCGQPISDDHREHQRQRFESLVASEQSALNILVQQGKEARVALDALRSVQNELSAVLRDAVEAAKERERALHSHAEVLRRHGVYTDTLARLHTEVVDMDGLYAQRAEFAMLITLANQAREQEAVRNVLLERQRGLEQALARAEERVVAGELDVSACGIDANLEASYKERQTLIEQRQGEAEVLSGLQASVAETRERLRGIEREIVRGEQEAARRAEVENSAQVALYTSQVLEQLETEWSQQIRPSLEGSVGELLGRLSDGRFDAVRLDTDYNVSVRDDGTFRPLADLSGGEIDLVALAMRLGLASVVAERHGSGGAGFLILDECFGSQDADRRGSILTALRSLRGLYGQIFLVSHVGGLDDAADAVIEIELDESKIAHAQQ